MVLGDLFGVGFEGLGEGQWQRKSNCGKRVYMMWLPFFLVYSNPFSRKCLNCGLKMEVRA